MSDHSRTRQGYAQLYLLGAFALRDSSGTDRTPKNKKAQAILAMLALSPRGTRTRAWLRNKLWSNSDEHHASSSLRQTLFELKKAFGPYTTDFIEFDRQSVSLQLDRIWVDVRVLTDNPGGMPARGQVLNLDLEFLEGMDINDEEFEDWLMMERAAWEARLDKLKEQDSFPEEKELKSKIPFRHRPRQIGIGLLPCITHGKNPDIHPLGDHICDSVVTSLAELRDLQIIDMRMNFGTRHMLDQNAQADFLVRLRVLAVAESITLTFLVYSASTQSLLTSHSVQFNSDALDQYDNSILTHFIGQNIDQLAKTLERHSDRHGGLQNDRRTLVGYSVLSGMFDLDRKTFQETLSFLERMSAEDDSVLFKGLLAYSSSFALGENLGPSDAGRLEMIEKLARDTLQANPFNSITLACLGHIYGYVFNRHELAAELFSKAVGLNPMQAFVWDHLALHQLYTGKLEDARQSSTRAVYLGAYSPINYTYETTSCMVSSLLGDHRRAVHLGFRALAKQPNFNAALRYSLASCGHLQVPEKAGELIARLRQSDPDFFDTDVQRNRFRLPLPDSTGMVLEGIRKATCLGEDT